MTETSRNLPSRKFEQGPIRPPSEAGSLLVRVTRNCPWNRCTFCPVYKGTTFSIRPVEDVIRDIDLVARWAARIRDVMDPEHPSRKPIEILGAEVPDVEKSGFIAAASWILSSGMRSVFLQDANSLVIKSSDLVRILEYLKERFPDIDRITSYARSHTVARMKAEDLAALRRAGLNRIHIGLESGSDEVLKSVKKGSTKAQHIEAGQRVKYAGIELSEYVMPGLGGRTGSHKHAIETADAINRIDPHFIRLRTLGLPERAPLYETWSAGSFDRCTDMEVVQEIRTWIVHLDGITGHLLSDHIVNLLGNLEGRFPEDKGHLLKKIDRFLEMSEQRRCLYQLGRRLGLFTSPEDMEDPRRMARVERVQREAEITPENIEMFTAEMMRRFV